MSLIGHGQFLGLQRSLIGHGQFLGLQRRVCVYYFFLFVLFLLLLFVSFTIDFCLLLVFSTFLSMAMLNCSLIFCFSCLLSFDLFCFYFFPPLFMVFVFSSKSEEIKTSINKVNEDSTNVMGKDGGGMYEGIHSFVAT